MNMVLSPIPKEEEDRTMFNSLLLRLFLRHLRHRMRSSRREVLQLDVTSVALE
jgi:hypothetical protein